MFSGRPTNLVIGQLVSKRRAGQPGDVRQAHERRPDWPDRTSQVKVDQQLDWLADGLPLKAQTEMKKPAARELNDLSGGGRNAAATSIGGSLLGPRHGNW